MKGSVFDKNDGSYIHYGNYNSNKVRDLLSAGHAWRDDVHGGKPEYLMIDFGSGLVVPDVARNQAVDDAETNEQNKQARIAQIKVSLAANYGNRQKDNETIDLLNELARL